MKKYEKPVLEVIQLNVQENLASTGNNTKYNMYTRVEEMALIESFGANS